jgi:hypothetical protein
VTEPVPVTEDHGGIVTTSLNPAKMALWDDNPSVVDLLGFDTVVAAV